MGIQEQRFVGTIPEFFYCGICSDVFEECMITKCGHRYCKKCLQQIIQKHQGVCAFDRQKIYMDECKFDQTANQFINLQLVYCDLNKEKKCNWKGHFSDLAKHKKKCNHQFKQEDNDSSSKYMILLKDSTQKMLVEELQKKVEEQQDKIEELLKENLNFKKLLNIQNVNKKDFPELKTVSWRDAIINTTKKENNFQKYLPKIKDEIPHDLYEEYKMKILEEINPLFIASIDLFVDLLIKNSREYPKSSERLVIICKEILDYNEKEIGIKLTEIIQKNIKYLFKSFEFTETITLNFGELLNSLIDYGILSKDFILKKIQSYTFKSNINDLEFKLKIIEYLLETLGHHLDEYYRNFFLLYFQSSLKLDHQYNKEMMNIIQSIEKINKRKIIFKTKEKEIVSILKN